MKITRISSSQVHYLIAAYISFLFPPHRIELTHSYHFEEGILNNIDLELNRAKSQRNSGGSLSVILFNIEFKVETVVQLHQLYLLLLYVHHFSVHQFPRKGRVQNI